MLFLKRRMCSSRVRACIRGVGRVSPRRHGVNMRCILGGGGLCARTKRDFYVFRKIHPGRALIRAGYSTGLGQNVRRVSSGTLYTSGLHIHDRGSIIPHQVGGPAYRVENLVEKD